MKRVFADAWFYIALLDADDQGHARAAAWSRGFNGKVTTTRWVLAEAANSLAAPALRRATAAFLAWIESDPESASSPTATPFTLAVWRSTRHDRIRNGHARIAFHLS